MAVPDYQSLMLPLLRFAGEKQEETSTGEAIDGEQLTNLMIEHEAGVSTVALYPIKKIDSAYFDERI